jgi:hypothetical protein
MLQRLKTLPKRKKLLPVNADIMIDDRGTDLCARIRGRWGKGRFACLMILVDYILHSSLCGLKLLISCR